MGSTHLLNGHSMLNGHSRVHHLHNIQHHDEEMSEVITADEGSQTNLIVNYLPPEMTEEELKTLFMSVGPLESCKLIRDKVRFSIFLPRFHCAEYMRA